MMIAANRTCGPCTLCCKLLAVYEIKKPDHEWCNHCSTKAGCAIYESRPQSCREFRCLWLRGVGPDELRPDRSKVIMNASADQKSVVLHVDPSRPDAWRSEIFNFVLDRMETSFIVCGDRRFVIKGEASTPATRLGEKSERHGPRLAPAGTHTL